MSRSPIRNMFNPITVKGKVCPTDHLKAAVAVMSGEFTNQTIAGAIGRAGFEPDDLWARQEVANRLLQRYRKNRWIKFDSHKRVWTDINA